MPRYLELRTSAPKEEAARPTDSERLALAIRKGDFSACGATVVGFGKMGREYLKSLQALKVKRIRVCSRSASSLAEWDGQDGISVVSGGYERLTGPVDPKELGIVVVPTLLLAAAARHLLSIGFRRLLIEKPVSLWSKEIESLARDCHRHGAAAFCATNRLAYPSFLEAKARAQAEGGIRSCAYTFTEMVDRIDLQKFPQEELARWGVANSLHVIGMAHGLIGSPKHWTGHRSGSLPWHPAGAVFVGSGCSKLGIPFSYHADWGSTGRWSVEIHTAVSSYRLCPLEKLFQRRSALEEWEELPVVAFDPEVKVGFVEQVAGMLDASLGRWVPGFSLDEAAELTRYGESIFGY